MFKPLFALVALMLGGSQIAAAQTTPNALAAGAVQALEQALGPDLTSGVQTELFGSRARQMRRERDQARRELERARAENRRLRERQDVGGDRRYDRDRYDRDDRGRYDRDDRVRYERDRYDRDERWDRSDHGRWDRSDRGTWDRGPWDARGRDHKHCSDHPGRGHGRRR